jgi:hypothetical protein
MADLKSLTSIPALLAQAIGEQQTRVWQLRNLIEAVNHATRDSNEIDDLEAALGGLVAMADEIHLGLNKESLEKKAEEIAIAEGGVAARRYGRH